MDSIEEIKGIGKKTKELFNKLGIYTKNDLIHYYPYRYEILKQTSLYEEKVVVSGIIETIPTISYFKNMNRLLLVKQENKKQIIMKELSASFYYFYFYFARNCRAGSCV